MADSSETLFRIFGDRQRCKTSFSNAEEDAYDDGCGDEAELDNTRVEIRRRLVSQGFLCVTDWTPGSFISYC